MKRLFIFLSVSLCCITCTDLISQTGEYVRGGYVSLSGDTTHGYIQDRLKVNQSDAFLFKATPEQGSPKEMTPEQVSVFFYAPNFQYRSLPVSENGATQQKFLRQLVTGYAELYEYNNGKEPVYILTKASGEMVQLEQHNRVEGGQLKTDKQYEGLIKYTLKDCESLILRGGRIDFTQGALVSYVRRYNACAHPESASEALTTSRRLRTNFGLLAGKDFIGTHGYYYNAAQPKSEGSGDGIQAGLLVHFSYFENLALRTGLVYHRMTFTQEGPYSFGTIYYINRVEMIDVPVNLRYQFGQGKVSPYLYGGLKFPIYLEKGITTQKIEQGEVENTTEDMQIAESLRFNGGIGARLKLIPGTDIDLNVEYEQWNVELNGARTFETHGLVLSAAILF